jgi:8-oxo-dGTP diphosphatase
MAVQEYCVKCGSPLGRKVVDGRERAVCMTCGWILWEQPIVGAGAVIERGGRLLLQRRTKEPFKGLWGLPGGHVESDEDPAEAVIRETREETGLQVTVDNLHGVFFFDDNPNGCGVFIVYKCSILGGNLEDAEEGSFPTFFAREHLPPGISGGGHRKAILAWGKSKGLTRQEEWSQLANAIAMRSSEDQVLWSIFGTFWAANAILLVALFTTGKLPEDANVGLIVSAVGVLISIVWDAIQRRALGHLKKHEALIGKMEKELDFERRFAISSEINTGDYETFLSKGIRARQIMPACSVAGTVSWLLAGFYFLGKIVGIW